MPLSKHFGSGIVGQGIGAKHANTFGRGWHAKLKVVIVTKIFFPSSTDSILDGIKHATAEIKRRLSHCFGAVNGEWIVDIFQQADIEDFGHVVKGWNLVRPGTGGKYFSSWANPCVIIIGVHNVFYGRPPHALHKSTFDLANINGWIATMDFHQK